VKRLAFLALLLIACAAPQGAPQSGAEQAAPAYLPPDTSSDTPVAVTVALPEVPLTDASPSQSSLTTLEAASATASSETAMSLSGEIGTALMAGWISWAEPDLGGDYLATRFPRGTLVRLCAVECIVRRTTDFGPSAAIVPSRIADLSVLDWEDISGLPRERGLVLGTVETIEIELPATATLEDDR